MQKTDAVHNRALRFVFTIILRAKSPRPSRYAYAYSLKTLEIVAKERGVPRVSLFLLNMNFRETKFLDEPSASNRWPQGKAIIRELS